jgi:hypothetical protein
MGHEMRKLAAHETQLRGSFAAGKNKEQFSHLVATICVQMTDICFTKEKALRH